MPVDGSGFNFHQPHGSNTSRAVFNPLVANALPNALLNALISKLINNP